MNMNKILLNGLYKNNDTFESDVIVDELN